MTLAAAGTDVVIFPAPRTENHRLFPSESFIGVGKERQSLCCLPSKGRVAPIPCVHVASLLNIYVSMDT